MFFEDEERKRVPKTKRELLLFRQKDKCAGCGKSFKRMGVTPRLHHIGKSNRIDALQLLCPNCHSQAHKWKTRTDSWTGEKETVLVKKRMGKKKTRKKRTKRKRESDEWSFF